MTEVKVFKLVSGQEFIGKVISDEGSTVVVESPVTLQPMRQNDGTLSVGMIPFSFGGKNNEQVAFQRSSLLCVINPDHDIENTYLTAISGLIMPTGPGAKVTLT